MFQNIMKIIYTSWPVSYGDYFVCNGNENVKKTWRSVLYLGTHHLKFEGGGRGVGASKNWEKKFNPQSRRKK